VSSTPGSHGMSALREALREFKEYSDDLTSSNYQNFQNCLERLISLFSTDAPLGKASAALLPETDFNEWYFRALETLGGMGGSATLDWPSASRERVALQLELLRRLASKDLKILEFCFIFTAAGGDFDSRIREFNRHITRPFARDFAHMLTRPDTPTTHLRADLPSNTTPHLVVLIHGIRTEAEWEEPIATVLRQGGLIPVPVRYGALATLNFLLPIPTLRRRGIQKLDITLKDIRVQHPTSPVSIVAHSFGTYCLAHLLRRDFTTRLHRVVLVGSTVNRRFPWHEFANRYDAIVNDCGSKDVWPVLAESCTWGYGASGTLGFGSFRVTDRFFSLGHSELLTAEFAEKYWLPFLRDGLIVDGPAIRLRTPWYFSLLTVFQLKWVAIALLVLLLFSPQAELVKHYVAIHLKGGRPVVALVYRAPGNHWEHTGSSWKESSNSRPDVVNVFRQFRIDDEYIYLVDPLRVRDGDQDNPLLVRIPLRGGTAQWSYSNPQEWTDLYVVQPEF
jgi:hypothetical protein